MALDLSPYLLATNELTTTPKQDNMLQAIEDALNHLGSASFGGFTSGAIFDPAKFKQNGATSGQVLMWSGTAWTPTSPSNSTFAVIADTTLGADTATFSFTSIPNTFKHLMIVCYVRGTTAATSETMRARFNNDTAGSYDSYYVELFGTSPTIAVSEGVGATAWSVDLIPAASATANLFAGAALVLPHYAGTANHKIAESTLAGKINTSTGNTWASSALGVWRSVAAINRIDFLMASGSFKAGSRITVYGI